jgi:ABC-type spermidine/putrescine transport system permease subunit I
MRRSPVIGMLLSVLPLAFMVVFIGVPLILSVAYALGDVGGINSAISQTALHQIAAKHGITFAVFAALFASRQFVNDLIATAWITVVSVVIMLAVSWGIALYMRFAKHRARRLVGAMYVVPMFIPTVIASYALVSFYNQGGFLSALAYHLGLPNFPTPGYTNGGVVLALVWSGIPFSTLLISAGLRSVPDSLLEAAQDVGAPWHSIFLRILVPLNLMQTAIVATFAIIGNVGSFTIPYLVGPNAPQMLGVLMYNSFSAYDQPQQAEAMAILMFLMALVVGFIYIRVNLRQERRGSGV